MNRELSGIYFISILRGPVRAFRKMIERKGIE